MSHPGAGAVLILPVPAIPEVTAGDDLAALLDSGLRDAGIDLADGDVLVVTSKVVSKAAGLRAPAATRAATVLAESRRVVAERMTPAGVTRIVESLAGPVLAAAGVDASNVGPRGHATADDTVLVLPRDPDRAAAQLHAALTTLLHARGSRPRFALVLSDTAGRAWRVGQVDFALGSAWLHGCDDLRGTTDANGRPLAVTVRAVADELASAADLVKGKAAGVAAAVVRGSGVRVDGDAPGAAELVRTGPADWFHLGSLESVRAALGAPPGTQRALDVGIPETSGALATADDSTHPSEVGHDASGVSAAVERACRLAALPDGLDLSGGRGALEPTSGGASTHTTLSAVRTHLRQSEVHVVAEDEFLLGAVTARLVAALAAEGIESRLKARAAGRAVVAFV